MVLVWGCDGTVLRVFMGVGDIGTFLYLTLAAGQCLDEFQCNPSSSYLHYLTRIYTNDSQSTVSTLSTILPLEIFPTLPKVTLPLTQFTIFVSAELTYLSRHCVDLSICNPLSESIFSLECLLHPFGVLCHQPGDD